MDDQTPGPIRTPTIPIVRRSAARLVMGRRTGYGVAHRRAATGRDRPRHAGGPNRPVQILVSLLVVVLASSLALVGVAAVGTMAAVAALSEGLPDPTNLSALTFSQPTTVYDRTGKIQLGRFQREQRRVVAYDEVPKLVLDATTTAEDRSFWENSGFDPAAIISAVGDQVAGTSERGASTITQQLVRARLLPEDVIAPGANRYLRKAKELIQSSRLTGAFPGEEGKQRIITAYLNEIFYGHDAYGIAAAARIYFGVTDLSRLTIAQAALLAGLPKSPSTLDPYRYAKADGEGRLVVPTDAPPIVRRDYILANLSTSRWTDVTKSELATALREPVILTGDVPLSFRAPHFTWQVRRQLQAILGPEVSIETGGYTVITTLDWKAESLAEKWLAAAAIAPNLKSTASAALLKRLKIGSADKKWINALRGKDLHNASLVAIDYRTGDVLAYVGSAGYYEDKIASREFEPKYDAAGDGARQPGSAFKPIVYASAFDAKRLSPGSLLLDITTEFGKGWTPRDADQLDRGPVLVRKALQYSLNVPAIRALGRVGNEAVAVRAEKFGIRFTGGKKGFLQAGLAGAIGTVEVRPIDLTSAFGALANSGVRMPARMILEVRDASGKIVYSAPKPKGVRAVSAQAAFLVTDILEGNTQPKQNPIWAEKLELRNGPKGQHRPAAVKTGTANDARDLATYGYLAPPKNADAPAYSVGIWMGNSDHSNPKSAKPATSLTAAAPLWRAFVRDLTAKQPIATFNRPKGLIKTTIDAWTGGRPGSWTRDTVSEWFIAGTQPGAAKAIDPAGLLYSRSCGGWRVDPVKAELGPRAWDKDVANWLGRARRGVGVEGPYESKTAYFWQRTGWGGPLLGTCAPKPKPQPEKPPKDPGPVDPGGGGGKPPKPTPPPAPTPAP
ncbi:MAG: transglycosylase domain-containing protein [Chloroflexi bacterium]|nr:transglycosylase domain-containing protein [Chloroflexota bacterium]